MRSLLLLFCVSACTSSGATMDGGADALVCDTESCADGVFCNGVEQCLDDACTSGADACTAEESCDEASRTCFDPVCGGESDADSDGHLSLACGGDDCDDADPNRYPGNTEVCDVSDHDEDCDPRTFGVRDADGDSAPDSQCCNVDASGAVCGTDCDDTRSDVSPTLPELCDLVDNDCDGSIDESAPPGTFYPDEDGDGFGTGEGVTACSPPPGHVDTTGDCDDDNPARHPGQLEVCDLIDNDCDDLTDEGTTDEIWYADCDGDGVPASSGETQMSCGAPSVAPGCGGSWFLMPAAGRFDCDDGNAAVVPGGTEVPGNSSDDDCDGTEICFVDGDNDGHRPTGPAATIFSSDGDCNDSGEGDSSQPADDCCDTEAQAFPRDVGAVFGTPRVGCGGFDYNCDGVDEPAYPISSVSFIDGDPNSVNTACSLPWPTGGGVRSCDGSCQERFYEPASCGGTARTFSCRGCMGNTTFVASTVLCR